MAAAERRSSSISLGSQAGEATKVHYSPSPVQGRPRRRVLRATAALPCNYNKHLIRVIKTHAKYRCRRLETGKNEARLKKEYWRGILAGARGTPGNAGVSATAINTPLH